MLAWLARLVLRLYRYKAQLSTLYQYKAGIFVRYLFSVKYGTNTRTPKLESKL